MDTFERLLARLSCREWSFPVYPRGSHLRACTCTWVHYVLCIHAWFTYVWGRAWSCSTCVCIPDLSRGRRQLTNCQTSYESLFKRLRRESSAAGRMKGRREEALVRSNIRQIWSRARVKFLLQYKRTNERNSTLHSVFRISTPLATNEIETEFEINRSVIVENYNTFMFTLDDI